MNPTARRNARYYALQAMYQWHLNHTPINELENEFLHDNIKRKKTDVDYFKELLQGAIKNTDKIAEQMQPFLSRSIAELDPIELSILQLGIYELLSRPDIPYRVAINEYLELTKQFGSIEGFKFVNGILDKVAHQVRKTEVLANNKK